MEPAEEIFLKRSIPSLQSEPTLASDRGTSSSLIKDEHPLILGSNQTAALSPVVPDDGERPISDGELRRAALRYLGGKWKLAPWIIEHFPAHQRYCEPYGGAFSVGLRKPPVAGEIYNELNPQVANFFRVLRDNAGELVAALKDSPRTRTEFERCSRPEGDSLERARRFYLFCQMSYSNGGGRWSSGTSEARLQLVARQDCDYLRLVARRLAKVVIREGGALGAIATYDSPDMLFYVDPTYVHSVRGSKDARHINGAPRRQYAYELTDEHHRELADYLHRVQGQVVLSGYRSALYDDLFPDWRRVERKTRTSSRGQRVECLWIKPG